MAMTLKKLLYRTTEDRKTRANYVRILEMKASHDEYGRGFVAARTYSRYKVNEQGRLIPNADPNHYVTQITFLDRRLHVHISCSCADNMFRWETANSYENAAEIEYSNGDAPNVTNPRYNPGLCIAKGSYVTTDTGSKLIEDIKVGDKVLTLNGYRKVTASTLTKRNEAVTVVQTTSRRTLSTTPDHEVYVVKHGALYPKWIKTEDISVGDLLVTLLPTVNSSSQKLDSLALLLGLVIAESDEGHFAPFGAAEQKEYAACYKKVFGKYPKLQPNRLCLSDEEKQTYSKFGLIFGKHSHRIPNWLLCGTVNERISLLYGLFQGDGWISDSGKASTLATTCFALARDFQQLFLSLGIHSTITKNVVRGSYKVYLVRPTTRGTLILLNLLPQLSKYLKKIPKRATVSLKEDIFVGSRAALISEFRKLLADNYPVTGKNTIVAARHFFREKGWKFTDGMPSKIVSSVEGSTKIKVAGTDKPLVAARKSLLQRFFLNNLGPRHIFRMFPGLFITPNRKTKLHIHLHDVIQKYPFLTEPLRKLLRITAPDVVYEKVISVKSGSMSDVYDLSVDKTHHFLANGFVVHNCKHAVALYLKIRPKLPDGA